MNLYQPQFGNAHIAELAHRRGLLDPDESLTAGLDRVSCELSGIDRGLAGSGKTFSDDLHAALHAGRVAVSSQLFAAAGRSGTVAACTVLPADGSTDAGRLRRMIAEASAASAAGMGCGLDVSHFTDPAAAVRAINAAIRKLHAQLIAQDRRPPALMISCRGNHPRVAEFVDVKHHADFAEWVANISVRVSGDPDEWDRLLPMLAASAHRNGEPGVLFQHAADDDNATPSLELTSTAPCAEVFLSPGERCVFVSVNLAAHVAATGFNWDGFQRSVALAVRAGDAAVELAAAGAAPVVSGRRRIGVGVCGYHSALIRLGIPYAYSAGFARQISEVLTFTAHRASTALARARGPFPLHGQSRWRNPQWLRRKEARRCGVISTPDWEALESSILADGVRNAAIVAYPPTGVVAELLGVSRSYEPHYTLVGRTGVASTFKTAIVPEAADALSCRPAADRLRRLILDPASGHQLPDAGVADLLACARQLPADVHLAVHTAFSGLADEAGAKTINLPADATVNDVASLLDQARRLGLKGLTVFRDGCLSERRNAA